MNDPISHHDLKVLILSLLDGSISPEDYQSLRQQLNSDSQARAYYTEYIMLCSALKWYGAAGLQSTADTLEDCDLLNDQVWNALAEYENTAPVIDQEEVSPQAEKIIIQRIEHSPSNYKVSKGTVFSLVTVAASVLFVVLFARFAPPRADYEVATLSDSIRAKWSENGHFLQKGARLNAGHDQLVLTEGYVELLFDNDTKVTLEAPADFQIVSKDQIKLTYGRLYAAVPKGAIGFTVNTSSARVIDLGTEFGIEAGLRGDTSLYVMKGKTVLIAGDETNKISMEVSKGAAKRVLAYNQSVSDISCNENIFVREIDSASHIIWHGERQIDLADIVSGGTGFESHSKRTVGIDVGSGKMVNNANQEIPGGSQGLGYVSVPELPFVDGVFVPDCDNGSTKVSSEGHTCSEFRETNGKYYIPIGSNYDVYVDYQKSFVKSELSLKGFSTEESSVICLHANAGITFDLNAIRSRIPARIVRFRTAYGISWNDEARTSIASDFYVLVDGQPRMVSRDVSEADGSRTVSIPLQDGDRFLTLACTEGQSNDGDWSLFANPILEIE